MRLVAAPDKFRGTIDALDVASAMAEAGRAAGWTTDEIPLSDGGEGFGAALGGSPNKVVVNGPLGDEVEARYWWLDDHKIAVVEMAEASGRALLPHPTPEEAFMAHPRSGASGCRDRDRGVRRLRHHRWGLGSGKRDPRQWRPR